MPQLTMQSYEIIGWWDSGDDYVLAEKLGLVAHRCSILELEENLGTSF